MNGVPIVTWVGRKSNVFVSTGCALCLTAPHVFGHRASEVQGTWAACCRVLPELAASAEVETGRVDR